MTDKEFNDLPALVLSLSGKSSRDLHGNLYKGLHEGLLIVPPTTSGPLLTASFFPMPRLPARREHAGQRGVAQSADQLSFFLCQGGLRNLAPFAMRQVAFEAALRPTWWLWAGFIQEPAWNEPLENQFAHHKDPHPAWKLCNSIMRWIVEIVLLVQPTPEDGHENLICPS